MILVDISDERFWNILFDEAYVEGQQAERIENELKKIITYDQEEVVKQLEELLETLSDGGDDWFTAEKINDAIEIVRNGGMK